MIGFVQRPVGLVTRRGRMLRPTRQPCGEWIVDTYQYRTEEERYARRVSTEEIEKNDYTLNISRYVSIAETEPDTDLAAVHAKLAEIETRIADAADMHNGYLRELGLPPV